MDTRRILAGAIACGWLVTFWAGCGQDGKEIIEPDLSGKADVLSEVDFRGQIQFDGEATGEFVNDFQFEAWTFQAAAGSIVTIDNSHQGTSADLDSTLFLYGPADAQGKFEGQRIASDDDAGWSRHARLEGVGLAEEGTYAIVLGTAAGDGRGRYRLTLSCVSGDCRPDDPEVQGCPGDVAGWFEMCMEAAMGDDGQMRHVAMERCRENIVDYYIDSCEYEAVPPSWCPMGLERFEAEVVPACVAVMDEEYPPDDLDTCDPVVQTRLEDCVEEKRVYQDMDLDAAVAACTDESVWYDLAEHVCEHDNPDWCWYDSYDVWDRMIGDCRTKLSDLGPLPPPPSAAEIERMTEDAVTDHLSYDDEGTSCDASDFQFEGYDTETNTSGDAVGILATSTARGPVNYCAGYTTWQCTTEFRPRDGAWLEMETDCEDIGGDW